MAENLPGKNDILGRGEIELLVSAFYAEVQGDTELGPVFDEVAKVDWAEHLPKICDFWETVLFRTGSYRGSPLAVHLKLSCKMEMPRSLFDRWLELFNNTIDRLFAGENAEHLKRVAADMANVIHSRVQEITSLETDASAFP